jgi:hypothetical protein
MANGKDSGNIIKPHGCASEFQDKHYGKGMRVFTCGPKKGAQCTVCGKN